MRTGLVSIMVVMGLSGLPASGKQPAGGTVEVFNRGIGGHTSRDGLRRFDRDVLALHPRHLILYFGINDALNSAKLVSVADFTAAMRTMITRAKASGIETIILITPNPIVAAYVKQRHPHHPHADLEAHVETYAEAVRTLAAEQSVLLADLRQWMQARGIPPEAKESFLRNEANSQSRDGVHLTAAGYRFLGEVLAGMLAPRAKPGDRVVCFGDSITFGAHMPGAGTATGETYPAWLYVALNRALGLTSATTPPRAANPEE